MEIEKLLKPKEVSDTLGISYRKLLDLIYEGSLPAYKIGGSWRIYPKDLKEYIEKNKQKTA